MTSRSLYFAALGGALALGALIGQAAADQPHMQRALDNLKAAHEDLVAATPHKGGHRAAALRATEAAIAETQAGMDFAARP